MRQLLEFGVHFGHQTRFWCPKMSPYIYGHRNKIHIINLERTLTMLNEAMDYLTGVAAKRGSVVFVGTKRQAGKIVREQAQRAECPYVYHRWLGGMLTNHRTVRRSIDRLNELNEIIESDGLSKLAKKEAMRIEREQFRLDRNLAGIMHMRGLPDALFVIDVKHENIAVKEANKLGIPVVAVVDTNCDPEGIDYVIPGNDDAVSAIRLYCTVAADAVLKGKQQAAEDGQGADSDLYDSVVSAEDISSYRITGARAAVAPSIDTEKTVESETAADAKPEEAPVGTEAAKAASTEAPAEAESKPEAVESGTEGTDVAAEATADDAAESQAEAKVEPVETESEKPNQETEAAADDSADKPVEAEAPVVEAGAEESAAESEAAAEPKAKAKPKATAKPKTKTTATAKAKTAAKPKTAATAKPKAKTKKAAEDTAAQTDAADASESSSSGSTDESDKSEPTKG